MLKARPLLIASGINHGEQFALTWLVNKTVSDSKLSDYGELIIILQPPPINITASGIS